MTKAAKKWILVSGRLLANKFCSCGTQLSKYKYNRCQPCLGKSKRGTGKYPPTKEGHAQRARDRRANMPYADYEKHKAHGREYYWRNREKIREKAKCFYQENRLRLVEKGKEYWRNNLIARKAYHKKHNRTRLEYLKNKVFGLLGHVCSRCGFEDKRALQIDHIEGGGTKDLKQVGNRLVYLKLVLEAGTKKYQILCANCNWIKRHERDEQPKRKKLDAEFHKT